MSSTSVPAFGKMYIPIVNIPTRDISLRPELADLLPRANLEPRHLITLDTFPSPEKLMSQMPPENTQFVLMDHNSMTGQLSSVYGERVVGCIDHHVDEGICPQDPGARAREPRIIQTAGSANSLVVGYLRPRWESLFLSSIHGEVLDDGKSYQPQHESEQVYGERTVHIGTDVAVLALASILIDTQNLRDSTKTTQIDIDAVAYLQTKLGPHFDRQSLFDAISAAKADVGRLSLNDMLRRDYKQWTVKDAVLGTSAAISPLQLLADKALAEQVTSLLGNIDAFARSRNMDLYAIMTAFEGQSVSEMANMPDNKHEIEDTDCQSSKPKNIFRRQLLLHAVTPSAVAAAQCFEDMASKQLQLQAWSHMSDFLGGQGMWTKIWEQGVVGNSRKQIVPLLREAMKQHQQ